MTWPFAAGVSWHSSKRVSLVGVKRDRSGTPTVGPAHGAAWRVLLRGRCRRSSTGFAVGTPNCRRRRHVGVSATMPPSCLLQCRAGLIRFPHQTNPDGRRRTMKAWQIFAVLALALAFGGGAARAECAYQKEQTKTSSLTAPAHGNAFA